MEVNLEEVPYQTVDDTAEAYMVLDPKCEQNKGECLAAKKQELFKLETSKHILLLLVKTEYPILGFSARKMIKLVADCIARGFEEEEMIQSDSPTLSKAGLRIITTIAASKHWVIQTTDYFRETNWISKFLLNHPKKLN